MPSTRSVLLILVLFAGSLSPPAAAQEGGRTPQPVDEPEFYLEQNYPNPVNPDTWIPFYLGDSLFVERDTVAVTVQVVNILRQTIAIPKALEHHSGERVALNELPFTQPGRYVAYWNGRDVDGERVPSAVYYVQMLVDGEPSTPRKMIIINPGRRRGIIPWFGRNEDGSD